MFTQLNSLPSKAQVQLSSPCFQETRNVETTQPGPLRLCSLCGPETALLRVEHRAEVRASLHLIHCEILGKHLRSRQGAKATSMNQRPVPWCAAPTDRSLSTFLSIQALSESLKPRLGWWQLKWKSRFRERTQQRLWEEHRPSDTWPAG